MPADCQIDQCGVIAIGRCSTCGQAFCTSHRALIKYEGCHYTDLCTNCSDAQEDQQKDRARREEERNWRQERRLETVLDELRRRGNPGLVERLVLGARHRSAVRTLVGLGSTERRVRGEPAWPIGPFEWRRAGRAELEIYESLETGYTASGHVVPMHHAATCDEVESFYINWRLAGSTRYDRSGQMTPKVRRAVLAALERNVTDSRTS